MQTHQSISYRDVAQQAEIRNNKCARACHMQEHLALPDTAASTPYPSQLPALVRGVCKENVCLLQTWISSFPPSCHQIMLCPVRDRQKQQTVLAEDHHHSW